MENEKRRQPASKGSEIKRTLDWQGERGRDHRRRLSDRDGDGDDLVSPFPMRRGYNWARRRGRKEESFLRKKNPAYQLPPYYAAIQQLAQRTHPRGQFLRRGVPRPRYVRPENKALHKLATTIPKTISAQLIFCSFYSFLTQFSQFCIFYVLFFAFYVSFFLSFEHYLVLNVTNTCLNRRGVLRG